MPWYLDTGLGRERVMFRFARQWPKAVIAIGLVLSVVWIAFLAWLMVRVFLAAT
jgi:hypothetical protein